MFNDRRIRYGLVFFSLFLLFFYVMEFDAFARFGGGRSFGSRGSRSFSSPGSPSSSPTSPSRQYGASPSSPAPSPYQQPQGGGFLRGLAGGVVGGMIGGMLFRSLGFGGAGGMGGGIGIFDIILIGVIIFGIWWFIKKKRKEKEAAARPTYFSGTLSPEPRRQGSYESSLEQPEMESDVDTGLGYIRRMDTSFDEQKFKELSLDNFFKLQGAWANRDMSAIRSLLSDEMYGILQGDAEELKRSGRINRLENIAVRSVDIIEAWQEAGKDFITVRFSANLLDYTIDATSGQVLSGSKTDPVKFEEHWTFMRPVGSNPWQLSAISQM